MVNSGMEVKFRSMVDACSTATFSSYLIDQLSKGARMDEMAAIWNVSARRVRCGGLNEYSRRGHHAKLMRLNSLT